MYINTLRQHIVISWITIILTVWIFLFLGHIFDKQIEKDYPDLRTGEIFVEKNQIDNRSLHGDAKDTLRQYVLQDFLQSGFAWFDAKPYAESSTWAHITTRGNSFTGDLIVEAIAEEDPLDTYINTFLWSYNDTEYQIHKEPFLLPPEVYETWTWVLLFKDVQDLYDMGYDVVSHRTRINKDADYRRHNIATALQEFGSVRLVNPGEELSFIEEIWYDPLEQELYKKWFTVVLDEDQTEYGWGLCGASTALYQWLLTNTAIEPAERRVHTQRYGYLYDAEVNGKPVSTPWLDSTIYDGHIDYKIHNTATYPIIIVANYNGEWWWLEEVFSLAKSEDTWSFEHDYTRPNSTFVTEKWVRKKVYWWCYGRIINGEERESCYKSVN